MLVGNILMYISKIHCDMKSRPRTITQLLPLMISKKKNSIDTQAHIHGIALKRSARECIKLLTRTPEKCAIRMRDEGKISLETISTSLLNCL